MPTSDPTADRFAATPINRLLGFEFGSRSATGAEVRLPVRRELLQETGIVHGGVLASLADTAAVYALLPGLPDGHTMASIEFKVNFLRPALPDAGFLLARSTVVKFGKTVAVCDVDVLQADRLVAKGSFTYLIFEAGAAE